MPLKELDNLVKINTLKIEPPDQNEFNRMVESARRFLKDAKVEELSEEGKFSCVYSAAHILSLAALRWHGYRSSNRYQVFQCLVHTAGFEQGKCRILSQCHNLRNIAEYERQLDVTPQLLDELLEITKELLVVVERMGPVPE
jgi:hypothetical protein